MVMMDVHNLTFGYGSQLLLRGISFRVESRDIVRIAGPNGAGKSTLLHILAGLIPLGDGQGSIRFSARGAESGEPAESNHVNSAARMTEFNPSESNGLYGNLSAFANLAFWARLRQPDIRKERLVHALNFWGFQNQFLMFELPVEKFSTGMKKRVALARVQISHAPLWILDEPTNGLDARGIETLAEALALHQAQGGATIIVAHDNAIFKHLSHRTLRLDDKGSLASPTGESES